MLNETVALAASHNWFTDIWNHPEVMVSGYGVAVVVSAAIRALPKPEPMGNKFYQWFYVFSQIIHSNLDKSEAAKKSQLIVDEAKDRVVERIVSEEKP